MCSLEVVQGGFFLRKKPSSFVASVYSYWRTALPPPVFWTQNTCFHELTDCVALQNRQNKGVARKIVQDKELAAPLQDTEDD
jgi:hypothetical protein